MKNNRRRRKYQAARQPFCLPTDRRPIAAQRPHVMSSEVENGAVGETAT
jgi:hypothetical protein